MTISSTSSENTIAEIDAVFAAQRRASRDVMIPNLASRKAALKELIRALKEHQHLLAEAMSDDFGKRAHSESLMADVLAPVLDIQHTLRHLPRWMKPSRRWPELLFASNRCQVRYQPKGVVGVIVPWNFPIYLAAAPLGAALAAGNRVMIKMSEYTPATSRVFAELIADIFPANQVAVFNGEADVAQHFSSLPFDHLIFTGSTEVGRHVMQAAAKNLTPVTLELGGKSPAIVSGCANLEVAASRIVNGKGFNSGQACVAPDYVMVPRAAKKAFIAAVKRSFQKMYPTIEGNPDYTGIVNDRQHDRLLQVLDDARSKGAKIDSCAPMVGTGRQLPLQIVTGVTDDMLIMQEEIFGPLLPVIPYDTIGEAIAFINERQRPLALYYFGHNRSEREKVLQNTLSGGVTVNDWGWHVLNHDLPFGGIGPSGMGHYHGHEGFKELSHARAVFMEHRFFPIALFHPPYGGIVQRLTFKLFLGKGKPNTEQGIALGMIRSSQRQ